ncbi:MAG: hypothetical protein K6G08_06875 [Prevotella sp.]|nr:hypothetical protein [Prevotella sp.]
MDNPIISLAIFGNQHSNSGFQPLYWINNPAQKLENLVPPGMEDNSYFFVLETGTSHTQYTLIQNHVSSYMSVRAGVLKMAIGIPAGYRIAGGQSPLAVLLRVRQYFIENCLTQKSSVSETYNFTDKLANPEGFKEIVDSYTLEKAPSKHRPMRGTDDAMLLLDEPVIAELFKDVQYPEFEPYRSIVVAAHGSSTGYSHVLTGLTIPRRPNLQLVVNGKPQSWSVSDYYKEETRVELRVNQRCWDSAPAVFKVDDLLQHDIVDEQHGIEIRLDSFAEQVVCNIKPREKRMEVKVMLEGVNADDTSAVLHSLTVLAGPKKKPMALSEQGTLTLSGNDIMYLYTKEIQFDARRCGYIVVSSTVDGNDIRVKLGKAQENRVGSTSSQLVKPVTKISPGQSTYSVPPPPSPFKKYWPWLAGILALGAIVLVVVLLLSGSNEKKASDKEDKAQTETENSSEEVTSEGQDVESEEPIEENDLMTSFPGFSKEQMEDYQRDLKDPNLTFDIVEEMADWVNNPAVEDECNKIDPQFVNRVKGYKDAVEYIRRGDLEGAIDLPRTRGNDLFYIVHLWQMKAGTYGWVDQDGKCHPYQMESANKANNEFESHFAEYTSFKDIDDIHTIINPVDDRTSPMYNKIIDGWPGVTSSNRQSGGQSHGGNGRNSGRGSHHSRMVEL